MLPGYLCGRAGFVRVEMHTDFKPGGDAVRAHYWKKFTVVENCEKPKNFSSVGLKHVLVLEQSPFALPRRAGPPMAMGCCCVW